MPDEEEFPSTIREFIRRHLRSVEQLEILLLIHSKPNDDWTVQSVYSVIKSSNVSVERWLNEFVQLGFAEMVPDSPPRYRYAAAEEMQPQVDAFAEFYRLKPVRVVEAIFQRHHDSIQGFADAFKLKRRDP